MTKKDEGRRQGRLFRDEAMERVLANEHSQWQGDVEVILDELIHSGKPFDADDLTARAREKEIAEPHHPNCWGAVMGLAVKHRRITMVRTVKAATPTSHASMIGKWIKSEVPEWMYE